MSERAQTLVTHSGHVDAKQTNQEIRGDQTNMEKILHDVLNAGIALFRSGEDSLNNAVKEVQRTFDELKEKGAADSSEAAVKLRKALDDVVQQANELSGKADATYSDSLKQLEELYANVLEQIKNIVPEDRITELRDKMDELNKVIKERVDSVTGQKGSAG
jgi:polyhydroxyalkanoate synthesis regulator phasin